LRCRTAQGNRKDYDRKPRVAAKPETTLLICLRHIADAVWPLKIG
jgi:hypothetical protein